MKQITIENIKTAAQGLIDTDRISEYTRGICELIAEIDAIKDVSHADRSAQIAAELQVHANVITNMW